MASNNSSRQLPKKKVTKKKITKSVYPKIVQDKDNNFLSIKLKAGVEAKSYIKKGIIFSENKDGEIIEIQVA